MYMSQVSRSKRNKNMNIFGKEVIDQMPATWM